MRISITLALATLIGAGGAATLASCGPEDECGLYSTDCGDEMICQPTGPVDTPSEQIYVCRAPCQTDADCDSERPACWSGGMCDAEANPCNTTCGGSCCCTYKRDPDSSGQCIQIYCSGC